MRKAIRFVIGMDLGDRWTHVSVLDRRTGEEVESTRVRTTREAMTEFLAKRARSSVVMETGTHSPWLSRVAAAAGHDVVVADARRLRAVWDTPRKNDRRDALLLADLAASPRRRPLCAVRGRDERSQAELSALRSRERVVEATTGLGH